MDEARLPRDAAPLDGRATPAILHKAANQLLNDIYADGFKKAHITDGTLTLLRQIAKTNRARFLPQDRVDPDMTIGAPALRSWMRQLAAELEGEDAGLASDCCTYSRHIPPTLPQTQPDEDLRDLETELWKLKAKLETFRRPHLLFAETVPAFGKWAEKVALSFDRTQGPPPYWIGTELESCESRGGFWARFRLRDCSVADDAVPAGRRGNYKFDLRTGDFFLVGEPDFEKKVPVVASISISRIMSTDGRKKVWRTVDGKRMELRIAME